jgi:glucose-6-phosphate-specific signal transduction histidine kinase
MCEVMSNGTMSERKSRRLRLMGITMGAGLTLLFGAMAALLAGLAEAPSMMLVLSALAFLAVGFVALRLRSGEQPVEPAIGAASTVLLISLVQLWLTPELTEDLQTTQVAISLLISVVFAFTLTWVGGVLGYRSRMRATDPNAPPPRASRKAHPLDRMGPSSQPLSR